MSRVLDAAQVIANSNINTLDVTIPIEYLSALDEQMASLGMSRISNSDPASAIQSVQSVGISSTTNASPQVKVSLTSGALAIGTYSFAWSCEGRIVVPVVGQGVLLTIALNGTEQSRDFWADSQWHSYSGAGSTGFALGATPLFELNFASVGGNAVEIRRARMSLILEN